MLKRAVFRKFRSLKSSIVSSQKLRVSSQFETVNQKNYKEISLLEVISARAESDHQRAIAILKDLIAREPQDLSLYKTLANVQFGIGDTAGVIEALDAVLAVEPLGPHTQKLYEMSQRQIEQGKLCNTPAGDASVTPKVPNTVVQSAKEHHTAQELSEAWEAFKNTHSERSADHIVTGKTLLEFLNGLSEIGPFTPAVLSQFAKIEGGKNNFVTATHLWELILQAPQENAAELKYKDYFEMSRHYIGAGMPDLAFDALEKARALRAPEDFVARRRAFLFERLHQWQRALDEWTLLVSKADKSIDDETKYLQALLEVDLDRAARELEADGDRVAKYYRLFRVRVLEAQKRLDWSEAFKLQKSATEMFPDKELAWSGLAHAHISRMEYDECISLCRNRMADGDGKIVFSAMVKALLKARRVNEAELEIASAEDAGLASSRQIMNWRAECLKFKGLHLEAAKLLEAEFLENPGEVQAVVEIAKIYCGLNRPHDVHRVAGWISPAYDGRQDVAELRAWQAADKGEIDKARAYWSDAVQENIPAQKPLETPLVTEKEVPPPANIQLFAFLRNEKFRLPYFLEYYRQLGVERFYFVDNNSNDGSYEYLRQQDDVIVFRTEQSYREAVSGIRWINHLVNRFGGNGWCLHVDVDEFLVLPEIEERGLEDYLEYLEAWDFEAVRAIMLDLYAENGAKAKRYVEGTNPNNVCRYFDNNYRMRGGMRAPYWWVEGGVRERLFDLHDLLLFKTPLIRAGRGIEFVASSHFISPANVADLSGAILHYKFLGNFSDRIAEEAVRKEYSNSAKNMSHLDRQFQQGADEISWIGSDSCVYEGSKQLIDFKLMEKGAFGTNRTALISGIGAE